MNLDAQRAITKAFIDDDPTTIVLIPRVQIINSAGSAMYVNGTPRAPLTVKLVELSFDGTPTATVAGVERRIDYHVIAPWNAEIAVGDRWQSSDGTWYEIIAFSEGWDYMIKAMAIRHIPRSEVP